MFEGLGQHLSQSPGVPQPENGILGQVMGGAPQMGQQEDELQNQLGQQQPQSDQYRKVYEQAVGGQFSPAVNDENRGAPQHEIQMKKRFDGASGQMMDVPMETVAQAKEGEQPGYWSREWTKFTDAFSSPERNDEGDLTKDGVKQQKKQSGLMDLFQGMFE